MLRKNERKQQMAEDGTSALTIPCIAPCPSSSSGLDVGISDLKAFGDRKFFWKKKELVIRFLDGDEKLHSGARLPSAREWTKYANIIFTFSTHLIPILEFRFLVKVIGP